MKPIDFFIPGNPVALKRHRTMMNMRGRSIQYDPSKSDKADFLAKAMERRPAKPLEGPLSLSIVFNFARPKSHYRTGKYAGELKSNAPVYHTCTPDLDNLLKFVGDAFNGVFWKDDSAIARVSTIKKYEDAPGVKAYSAPVQVKCLAGGLLTARQARRGQARRGAAWPGTAEQGRRGNKAKTGAAHRSVADKAITI
ncbi:MAG: RusA family crossover junction endodeoxyribonuclease [Planctomycetes bacterium]|nr:RusA family crossover junction endodeoxyribonuclease [Planctomycetota bacterium]